MLDGHRKAMYRNTRNVQRYSLRMPVFDDDPVFVLKACSGDLVRFSCGRGGAPGMGVFALELGIDDERS